MKELDGSNLRHDFETALRCLGPRDLKADTEDVPATFIEGCRKADEQCEDISSRQAFLAMLLNSLGAFDTQNRTELSQKLRAEGMAGRPFIDFCIAYARYTWSLGYARARSETLHPPRETPRERWAREKSYLQYLTEVGREQN